MKQWQICQPKNRQGKLIWRNTQQEGEETMSSDRQNRALQAKRLKNIEKTRES